MRLNLIIRSTLASIFILLLCSIFAAAQAGPKYDPSTEAKFKGTIEDLTVPAKNDKKAIEHLTVKTDSETLDIYLCPKPYIDDMGVSFAKGDEIALTGSKWKTGDAEMVLAREVVKGTDTLILRDEKGNPVWNWNSK
jgi:hypothetical protein